MAQITINTPPAQDNRIAKAVGIHLALGRDATGAEIKGVLIDALQRIVDRGEQIAKFAEAKAVPPITPS